MACVQGKTAIDLAHAGVQLFITPASVEQTLQRGSLAVIKLLYKALGEDFAIKDGDGWLPFETDPLQIIYERPYEFTRWFFTSGIRLRGKTVSIFKRNSHQLHLVENLQSAAAAAALWPVLDDWTRSSALHDWHSFSIRTGDLELFKWCEPKLRTDEWQVDAINLAVQSDQIEIARYVFDKYNVGANGASILAFISSADIETLDKMRPFVTGNVDRCAMYEHAMLSDDLKTLQWVYNLVGKPRAFYIARCDELHKKKPEVIEWVFQKKLVTPDTVFVRPVDETHIPFYDLALKAGCSESMMFDDKFLTAMCKNAYSRELADYVLKHGVTPKTLALEAVRAENLDALTDLYDQDYRADDEVREVVRTSGNTEVKAWFFDNDSVRVST